MMMWQWHGGGQAKAVMHNVVQEEGGCARIFGVWNNGDEQQLGVYKNQFGKKN